MHRSTSTHWLTIAVIVALGYFVVGIGFGALAGAASSPHARFAWRLAAYVVSLAFFAGHIAYEHFALSASPRRVAWHVAAAVAIGAFGLAVAANLHRHGAGMGPRLALALVLWPLLTALPALVAALALSSGLARVRPRAPDAGRAAAPR